MTNAKDFKKLRAKMEVNNQQLSELMDEKYREEWLALKTRSLDLYESLRRSNVTRESAKLIAVELKELEAKEAHVYELAMPEDIKAREAQLGKMAAHSFKEILAYFVALILVGFGIFSVVESWLS